jgi:hypothetical protein
MKMTIHKEPHHPSIILARKDLTLDVKGLYAILFLIPDLENETIEQKIKRCCPNLDSVIESSLNILILAGILKQIKEEK